MRTTQRLLAAALALALVGAACGGGDDAVAQVDGDLVAFVAAAPDRTAAESARMRAEVDLDGDVLASVEAAVDRASGASSFAMDFEGAGSWLPDVDLGALGFEMRTVDGVAYLRADGFVGQFLTAFIGMFVDLPDDVEWLRFDTPAAASDQVGGSDPGELFDVIEVLRGAGSVEEVGREEVRGVDTTHYRAEVDPAVALEELDAEARAAAQDAFDKVGVGTVPVEVWVDGDGLVRRLRVAYDASELADGTDVADAHRATLTVELWDFGEDVEVAVPPADRTASIDDLDAGGMFGDLLESFPGLGD